MPNRRPSALVPAALVAALALAVLPGCGRSPERDVRATVEGLGQAITTKDYQRLCDRIFSKRLVAEVEAQLPCEVALQRSSWSGLRDIRVEVRRITVDGGNAQAQIRTSARGEQPSDDTVRLVREGEDWRVVALAS